MELPNNHYKDCVVEPIKVIKAMLTHEQFLGFLLGNVFKYRMRAGHKTEGDLDKALQYEDWYKEEKDAEPKTIRDLALANNKNLADLCAATYIRDNYKPELANCPSETDCYNDVCPYLKLSIEQLVEKLGVCDE